MFLLTSAICYLEKRWILYMFPKTGPFLLTFLLYRRSLDIDVSTVTNVDIVLGCNDGNLCFFFKVRLPSLLRLLSSLTILSRPQIIVASNATVSSRQTLYSMQSGEL